MPELDSEGYVKFEPTNDKQRERQKQPKTLINKVRAASVVTTIGAANTGYSTLMTLMWPVEKFTLSDATTEAFNIFGDALAAALEDMPRHRSDQILKAQVDRLI
ncbi:hypothetical protein [Amphritea sp. HPY]|uniref:hypothetical protein n=1 Tax=Amphritea sp. HPY TaxID=3421652 RepID=UPI003D7E132E